MGRKRPSRVKPMVPSIFAPSINPNVANPKSVTKRTISMIEGRLMALDMKKRGMTYREIAEKLTPLMHPDGKYKVSLKTAFEYVQAELLSLRQQTELDAQSVRDLELERCDSMMAGLWSMIKRGDPASVMAGIKVMERRSKLLGLDAPTKQEWVGAMMTISPVEASKLSDAEIQDRVSKLMNRVTVESAISRGQLTDGQPPDVDPEFTVQ